VLKKNGDDLSKMKSLNEALIKDIHNLQQENITKGKWENDESREELEKKG
jgi:hypothetical protein